MTTILDDLFGQIKSFVSPAPCRSCQKRQLADLNREIREVEWEMSECDKARESLDGRRHPTYLNQLTNELIKRHRALCDRRAAMRGEL